MAYNIPRTIKLGAHKDMLALRTALENLNASPFNDGVYRGSDFLIRALGMDLPVGPHCDRVGYRDITLSTEETEVDLEIVYVADDLGFREGADLYDICAKAQQLGLQPCTYEVAIQLRLEYKEQPNGERLYVAVEPFTGWGNPCSAIKLSCSCEELWLSSVSEMNPWVVSCDERFVFTRPRE